MISRKERSRGGKNRRGKGERKEAGVVKKERGKEERTNMIRLDDKEKGKKQGW